jgi:hypothetical protein
LPEGISAVRRGPHRMQLKEFTRPEIEKAPEEKSSGALLCGQLVKSPTSQSKFAVASTLSRLRVSGAAADGPILTRRGVFFQALLRVFPEFNLR